jgi:hypothetical protein
MKRHWYFTTKAWLLALACFTLAVRAQDFK